MAFTRESARAANAARQRKREERLLAAGFGKRPDPQPAPEHGAAELLGSSLPTADVVVPSSQPAPTIDDPKPDSLPAAGGDAAPAAPGATPAATPFTPEIAEMLMRIAFDVAGAATGRPHIWKADEDELKPLAEPMAHQLGRIPIVRVIGPDNTELVIVGVGLGVMVTKRLNEHADEVHRERDVKIRQLHTGERPGPREVPRASAPAALAPIAGEGEAGNESSAAELMSFKGV